MKKICISNDWYLYNDLCEGGLKIDLPYDYQIKHKRDAVRGTWGNGYYPDTEGKYVKYLDLDSDKHYVLDIDGAYMCTRVFLNEHQLATHPYGYTPFLVDLTDVKLDSVTNKLMIITSPLSNSSRWYTGNGIYRDVFLWEGGDVRIEPRDLFVSTLSLDSGSAVLRVRYTVTADYACDADIKLDIVFDNTTVQTLCDSITLEKGKNEREILITLDNAKAWSTDTPYLYGMNVSLSVGGKISDESTVTFGIRTVSADVEHGLLLNGKPIKLRGGCIHHDHGELGAAAYPAAEERKIKKLLDAGFNAIRCAHNPPSLALLEACDRLGMIVMDEAFDVWNLRKSPRNDYTLFFDDWCLRDVSYMVLRERNHPCVFSYSIGNEILEINGRSRSGEISKMLTDEIKKHDDTRFVTAGIQKEFVSLLKIDAYDPEDYKAYVTEKYKNANGNNPAARNAAAAGFEAPLDIVGQNYYFRLYEFDHEMYPDRVMWGSETVVQDFYRSWAKAMELPYVLGDFTWTAYDNMGEVGTGRAAWASDGVDTSVGLALRGVEYPWRNCYQGDLDLCGKRRPQSYFRSAVWQAGEEYHIFTTHPDHFGESFTGTYYHWKDVNETWTYEDRCIGMPVTAEIYTEADKVEWYVNGREVGTSVPEGAIASIDTVYEPGEISAVVYKDGAVIGKCSIATTGQAAGISIESERDSIKADGRDILYLEIAVTDREGRVITADSRELSCYVIGGELLAFYNANPIKDDSEMDNKTHAFKGRALALIRAKSAGDIIVTVSAPNLCGASKTFTAK